MERWAERPVRQKVALVSAAVPVAVAPVAAVPVAAVPVAAVPAVVLAAVPAVVLAAVPVSGAVLAAVLEERSSRSEKCPVFCLQQVVLELGALA